MSNVGIDTLHILEFEACLLWSSMWLCVCFVRLWRWLTICIVDDSNVHTYFLFSLMWKSDCHLFETCTSRKTLPSTPLPRSLVEKLSLWFHQMKVTLFYITIILFDRANVSKIFWLYTSSTILIREECDIFCWMKEVTIKSACSWNVETPFTFNILIVVASSTNA